MAEYSYFAEKFAKQDMFRAISVGLSPYLPATRGFRLKMVTAGETEGGVSVVPRDTSGDANYAQYLDNYFNSGKRMGKAQTMRRIQARIKAPSEELGHRLQQMIDFTGEDFANPTGHMAEGEIKNLMVLRTAQADLEGFYHDVQADATMSSEMTEFINKSKQKPFDHNRFSQDGARIIETIGASVNEKVQKFMNENVFALDVSNAVRSKYLTMDTFSDTDFSEESTTANIKAKVDEVNALFASNGKSLSGYNQTLSQNEKNTSKLDVARGIRVGAGPQADHWESTTSMFEAQSVGTVAKHLDATFVAMWQGGIYSQKQSFKWVADQQPLGNTGISAIIFLTPSAASIQNPNSVLQLEANVEYTQATGTGMVADSGQLMALGSSNMAQAAGIEIRGDMTVNEIAKFGLWTATSGRINAVADQTSQSFTANLVDNALSPVARTITTLSGPELSESIMKQMKEWALNKENENTFAKWMDKAVRDANDVYADWKRGAVKAAMSQEQRPRSDYWYSPGQKQDSKGIWNRRNSVFMADNPERGLGIGVSPYLVARRKHVANFGRE